MKIGKGHFVKDKLAHYMVLHTKFSTNCSPDCLSGPFLNPLFHLGLCQYCDFFNYIFYVYNRDFFNKNAIPNSSPPQPNFHQKQDRLHSSPFVREMVLLLASPRPDALVLNLLL